MTLNACGQIAEEQWYWLEEQYLYVKSHAFIVMPNHMHEILEINREFISNQHHPSVWTTRELSVQIGKGRDLNRESSLHTDGMKIKTLSELMGAYKTTVSKHIHLLTDAKGSNPYADFRWHRSFYDHIIRSEASYNRIMGYIYMNPSNWGRDKFFQS